MATLVLAVLLLCSTVQSAGPGTVPAPDSVLGLKAGADNKLATYDQSIANFKKLAASSKYLQLMEAGKTTMGRIIYFALMSDPKNLAKIDRCREIAQLL